jgi:hypothetical protein
MPTVTSANREEFNNKEISKRTAKKEKPSDKPMASSGLKSYRYKGRYGHIMIGAKDHNDALNEAKRSTRDPVGHEHLEMWDESSGKYSPLSK